jgi:hypothetical protein
LRSTPSSPDLVEDEAAQQLVLAPVHRPAVHARPGGWR